MVRIPGAKTTAPTTFLRLVALAAIALLAAPPTVHASERGPISGPISGERTVEFQNDWTAHSDTPGMESDEAYLTVESNLVARLAPGLSAHTHLTFEPASAPATGEGRRLRDEGLYIEEFYLQYAAGSLAFRGGKLGQKFGIAWNTAPGIRGTDFAKDYELSEQVGVAADFAFDAGSAGKYVVTGGTFFADTSVLSESVFTNHGHTSGAGNREDFSSYALALKGGGTAILPGLAYHLAYVSRGPDTAGETHESGLAAALTYTARPGDVEVAPILEWVSFDDRGGTPGTRVTSLTTGVAFIRDRWNLALSCTTRETRAMGTSDVDGSLAQARVSYTFRNGVGLNVGYHYSDESGVEINIYGFRVDYAYAF